MNDLEHYTKLLMGDIEPCEQTLRLNIDGYRLLLRSNSARLIELLQVYFTHVIDHETGPVDDEVLAVECDPLELPVTFIDWKREPGKSGRKDSYFDFPGGRMVRKVRTGMVFLQSRQQLIAAGPCIQYNNQLINYINSQYMNWLQNRGWLICHAAGITHNDHCLAMAGLSGGGKSTLMLNMLELPQTRFLSNDRLFIRKENTHIAAAGIPKLPRINPGTIVHNPRLHALIDQQERERLLALPRDELWHLENKYDVNIQELYGENHIRHHAMLSAFLIINWQHDAEANTDIHEVRLDQRRELLRAIMKSPGPFYQRLDDSFLQDDEILEERPYLETLQDIPMYELTGRIDFDHATRLLGQVITAI